MHTNPLDNPEAFSALAEPLVWTQDASPHASATIHGIVLHGAADSASAGHPLGTVTADQWTVMLTEEDSMCVRIAAADTLAPVALGMPVLTVQRIVRDTCGWIATCTAEERSPAP